LTVGLRAIPAQERRKALEEILQREFDVDLSDCVRDTLPVKCGNKFERSATLDLVDGFSRYEAALRARVREALASGRWLD
jgi:hypothetical protein